ncbi:kinase-like protein [Pluteus cervinus]|uniref:Kinase-like protein n=1 Tax=Pluteus cervinus TaxID=181527 RepID=A0ACD3B1U4_9AGAR|nr:kinase-like protein [Pluteus cervinus]
MSAAATIPDIHLLSSFRQWPSSSSSSSASTRSHLSSLSTTSSLSSTFSDVSIVSVPSAPPPSPPQTSKTSAFFASPFSTRPPSPPIPPSPPRNRNNKPRSLTADFFAATKTASDASIIVPENLPPSSRLFPSRYTSIAERASSPSPPSLELDQDLQPETPSRQTSRKHHIPSLILNANDIDSSGTRSTPIVINVNEPTPRPPSRIPAALDTTAANAVEIPHDTASAEPEPGTIITSAAGTQNHLSPSPSQPHFSPTLILETEVNIRLIRALGHGAFSSVWLAEDLSSTTLTLASKRSLRELKRRASGLLSRNSSLRSPSRLSLGDGTSTPSRASSIHEPSNSFTSSPTEVEFADKPGEFAATIAAQSLSYDSTSCSPPPCVSRAGSVKSSVSRSGSTKSTASSLKRKLRSLTDGGGNKLVAVKMTSRNGGLGQGPEADRERERTRAGFVREVEVLRHIAHPNITALLASLTTTTHHIIVLPYLPGGDLLSLVNNDIAWSKLGEDVLKRIWCELCKAVGWMHGVGIVHRDIKLENILLTTTIFMELDSRSSRPTLGSLPPPPIPVIKLTDFGLARFIDVTPSSPPPPSKLELGSDSSTTSIPFATSTSIATTPSLHPVPTFDLDTANPSGPTTGSLHLHRRPASKTRARTLLSTRCGSEAYAAPELVMGGGGSRGIYDARETDAWACGVVLYALIGRKLPFGEGVSAFGARIGGEPARVGGGVATGRAERRAWLMRIARGEWVWPVHEWDEREQPMGEGDILVGPRLVESEGARRIVERLLVRDPRQRMMVSELWDDEWMGGVGIAPSFGNSSGLELRREGLSSGDVFILDEDPRSTGDQVHHHHDHCEDESEEEDEMDDMFEEDDDEGWLVDEEGIQNIAREEVV